MTSLTSSNLYNISSMLGVKQELIDIKQINNQAKEMNETTRRTLTDLLQTKQKLNRVKKAYEILFSERYMGTIKEAFTEKIQLLEKFAKKQEDVIQILQTKRGQNDREKLEIKLSNLEDLMNKVMNSDELVFGLVKLQLKMEELEKKKDELVSKVSNASALGEKGSQRYSFK